LCLPCPRLCCAPAPPLTVPVAADDVAPVSRVRARVGALADRFPAFAVIPARVLVVVRVD